MHPFRAPSAELLASTVLAAIKRGDAAAARSAALELEALVESAAAAQGNRAPVVDLVSERDRRRGRTCR